MGRACLDLRASSGRSPTCRLGGDGAAVTVASLGCGARVPPRTGSAVPATRRRRGRTERPPCPALANRGNHLRLTYCSLLVTYCYSFQGWAMAGETAGEELRAELDVTNQALLALRAELSAQREELEQARSAAVQTSHAIAAFLANMSHEIRSPLNAVIGFTSLLKQTPLSTDQAEYAETLMTAVGHLYGLVDDILDLSKIESGRLDLEEIPFDLFTCVEDAAGIVAPHAEEKDLALAALFAPGIPGTVVGDPVRLRQILVNLLSNAVKFTARGEITIEAIALPADGQRCRLVFDVHDTGPESSPMPRTGYLIRSHNP